MDTFCGLGLPELIIIALLGFVLIGPERTRELALQFGRMLRRLMKSPWWREFNQVTDALRNLPTTLVRMAELEEAQAELQRELSDIERQTRASLTLTDDARTRTATKTANPWGIERAAGIEPEEAAEAEAAPEKAPETPEPHPEEPPEAPAPDETPTDATPSSDDTEDSA